ncbi:MAG TPA: DinB family protein [Longimicrobium sp.]|nr:DinB family protein [Longimicrobium sp.]
MTRVEAARRQAERTLDRLLRVFDKAVLRIPADRLHFRPTPENMSAATMAHHVYEIVLLTALGLDRGEVSREDADALGLDLDGVERPEQVVAWGARVKEYAHGVVAGLSDEVLDRPIRYYFGMTASGEDSLRTMTEEVLHHRGQMQVYLRLMGVEPPSLRDVS